MDGQENSVAKEATHLTCMCPHNELRARIPRLWQALTRKLTRENVEDILKDSKVKTQDGKLHFYVPSDLIAQARAYLGSMDTSNVVIEELTSNFCALELLENPGLLSVSWGNSGEPLPYVVPGGRFNELYGWDSYFITLGLLQDGMTDLAEAMVEHFCFEIEHYGKILNANRSYYLDRSQPPFLTDMAIRVHDKTNNKALLVRAIECAIKEYKTIWTSTPRLDPKTTLSRYNPPLTRNIPIETELGHFDETLGPYARKHSLSIPEFTLKYESGQIKEPTLDKFLQHDRAIRESGHDTSTRFHNVCSNLATIDLNSLLYKYECDIASVVEKYPHDFSEDAREWQELAQTRKKQVMAYLWNDDDALFYDYNVELGQQHKFPSVTALWALWSGLAPQEVAGRLKDSALRLFEQEGGLSCTVPLDEKIVRQWDYPYAWAPHQILAWKGLEKYGFRADSVRLANKWVSMIAGNQAKSSNAIFEKYNVVDAENPHDVTAEYGNQGSFKEGFGWTNASVSIAIDDYIL